MPAYYLIRNEIGIKLFKKSVYLKTDGVTGRGIISQGYQTKYPLYLIFDSNKTNKIWYVQCVFAVLIDVWV
jgi:hypothetical protein